MKNSLIIAVLVAGACASSASAVPTVWYNPANGSIHFNNDHAGPLAHISFISESGSLRDASWLLSIPGAVKDNSELPFAFTYLGLPVGVTYAGNIVQPGTPISDLHYQYRLDSFLEPISQGVWFLIPEPTSCTLGVMSALALVGTARCVRRGVV
ncbi:MAG: hypothetical protein C0485_11415 [Pirellula sp.]|nr:hypothetical protein [Pirellula sp.]